MDTSDPSLWDDEEASTTDCSGSSAVAASRCCDIRDVFSANGGSAWDGGGAVISTMRREVLCVGSLLTLENGMDVRVAISSSDDEIAGVCFPLGLLSLVHRKHSCPIKVTAPPILLSQKTHLIHRERRVHRPVDRVRMRLSKLAFSPS